MDKQKKQECLAELDAISQFLNTAMDADDFCKTPTLSLRRCPQISYVALKRIAALLKRILD